MRTAARQRLLRSVFARSAVAAALLAPSALTAQPGAGTPLEIARTHRLTSRALGEERTVDVAVPRGYGQGTDTYPVIVVLDGKSNIETAAAITRAYSSSSMMPGVIVVGVRNNRRTRDFTPAPVGDFRLPPEAANAGGADRFLAFLGDELLPWVERNYRAAPLRVLVGHSLGGLFALHALAVRPELFTGYVVMEPSVWWNNGHEVRAAERVLADHVARRSRLMLVNSLPIAADTTAWGGRAPMVRQLSTVGETHESMAAAGMLVAFRTMFEDFRPSEWRPGTRPAAILERYDSLAERVGYRVPIPASAYEQAIRMSIHARLWDDAERMLSRMERAFGSTSMRLGLEELLAEERATPPPTGLIPLEIPARRPTPSEATRFLGAWVRADSGLPHEITVRASGDTIIVHDRIQFPTGDWYEGDGHVITVTPAGVLEWGLPWFRGIAALLVQEAALQPDGTLRVTREPRGWVPRGPGGDMNATIIFRRR